MQAFSHCNVTIKMVFTQENWNTFYYVKTVRHRRIVFCYTTEKLTENFLGRNVSPHEYKQQTVLHI